MKGRAAPFYHGMDLADWARANLANLPQCADYDRMVRGLAYNSMGPELTMRRVVAHERAIDYGAIRIKDHGHDVARHQQARAAYLALIFGRVGTGVYVEPPFYVDYGCNVAIGENFYANFNATFLDCLVIRIGDNVLLGPNVTFTTATHPVDPAARLRGEEMAYPITVEDNVWVGANAVVLPGVTVGEGSVIAAGAVVNRDVPKYTVVAGVPAKVIKELPRQ